MKKINPVPKPAKKKKGMSDAKLLSYWSQAVKERAGNKCEYPDCNIHYTSTQAHHLYTKKWVSMRYNMDAGICLCPYHHTLSGFAAHKDPDFQNILILAGVRTGYFFAKLRAVRNQVTKNTPDFKQACYEKIKVWL